MIQDGRVDIQTKNAGYGENGNRNAGRQNKNQAFNARNGNDERNQIVQRVPQTESTPGKANVQCYNCNDKGHYARNCQKPGVRDANYFKEQMLLSMKDEGGSNLKDKENDFMLYNSYGDETMEELTAAVIMMARIQPTDDNPESEPSYDAKAASEVNASNKLHEQVNRVKLKTIIHISDDDQIDSNIIFDDPYVENNGSTSEHDLNAHDEYHDIQMLAYNVKKEAENKKRLNNELKNKKAFKEREDRYLEDICDLEEKLSSHDRIVYKIGQSIQTIHMLGKQPNRVYDPFLKAGLGYKNLERLKKAIAAQPKMYHREMLHSTNLKIDSPDSEETLEDAEEIQLKMRNKMFYKIDVIPMSESLSMNLKELQQEIIDEKNEMLRNEFEKSSSDSEDIQANLLKRIKILENDFKRSQAQSIEFELKLQHQKEKMACDVSWKSRLSTLNDENVLLKTQVDSVVNKGSNSKGPDFNVTLPRDCVLFRMLKKSPVMVDVARRRRLGALLRACCLFIIPSKSRG
ncbi:retrovirus-related pol polyprotein from transposon TNT 1-94, partial [Tanacetum coccineum]